MPGLSLPRIPFSQDKSDSDPDSDPDLLQGRAIRTKGLTWRQGLGFLQVVSSTVQRWSEVWIIEFKETAGEKNIVLELHIHHQSVGKTGWRTNWLRFSSQRAGRNSMKPLLLERSLCMNTILIDLVFEDNH